MTREQVRKHDRICRRILIALGIVLVLHMVLTTIRGNIRQQEEREQKAQSKEVMQQTQQEADEEFLIKRTKEIHESGQQTESEVLTEERLKVFDSMSADWGGEQEGFVYYQIPEEFTVYGGYLPEKMQIYTYCVCKQYGVKYALIVAMIERESGYIFDRIGDGGNSIGYMQIYESAHVDRMERLGCTNLLNPYQNVRVGIDYIAELIEKYETIQDALAAYNYGEKGAREKLWNNGVYVYEYNEGIMNRMKEIEEELAE